MNWVADSPRGSPPGSPAAPPKAYPLLNDQVLAVFAAAAERGDPRLSNVYVDVATNVTDKVTVADSALVAQRVRQLGARRVLYGSDLSPPGGSIRAGWDIFRAKVPLTDTEFRQIAANRPRFMR